MPVMIAFEAAAHGAELAPGPVAPAWMPYITAIVVFGVAFGVLRVVVWPKILGALDERDRKIRDEIKAAEEARAKAKAAQAEYEGSLKSAREEAVGMIAKAKADAKAVADDLKAANAAELTEKLARANREIDSAKHAAIAELHAQAGSLAAAIAGKILQREISVEDQQRLVEESLRELASAGNE